MKRTKLGAALGVMGLGLAGLAALTGTAHAQEMRGNGLIVDAAWLAENLGADDLVVLQVGPPELFAEEHIQGAQPLLHQQLAVNEGTPLELPELGTLRSRVAALGVGDDSRIVVVHSAQWITPTARVVFTLDYLGLGAQTHVLDGGLDAWKAAGYPVTHEVTEPTPGNLTRPAAQRVVTHEWVQENSERDGVALFDARAQAFYDGVRDDHGGVGHIPGAESLPWQELVREDGEIVWFRSDEELRGAFESRGTSPDDLVVGYCHIGQFATMVLLGARAAGYEVRLFDGSMHEWGALGLPLVSGTP